MNALKLAIGTIGMSLANVVLAQTTQPCGPNGPPCPLPLETDGMFAVAAILLMAGVMIVRQKRAR